MQPSCSWSATKMMKLSSSSLGARPTDEAAVARPADSAEDGPPETMREPDVAAVARPAGGAGGALPEPLHGPEIAAVVRWADGAEVSRPEPLYDSAVEGRTGRRPRRAAWPGRQSGGRRPTSDLKLPHHIPYLPAAWL